MSGPRFEVVAAVADGLFGGLLETGASPSPSVPDLDLDTVIRLAQSAGLRGRGGAGFPVARKLAAVAEQAGRLRRHRRPVVVINAAEGEPASGKDAALLRHAPHAVLAGAGLLAQALGTTDVRVWGPGHDPAALRSVATAADSRRARLALKVVAAPARFVAGEGSAAARGVAGRDPLPRTDGVRTSIAGVDGRPTLVLNAETAAQLGRLAAGLPVTRLVTVVGAVATPGVVELPNEVSVTDVLAAAGGVTEPLRAMVLGGYHGRWYGAEALELVLGAPAGPVADCSIVAALPDHACLVAELDSVAAFLAGESAGQCGPCVFGMPELARSVRRAMSGRPVDLTGLPLVGRGACHHPDGSVGFVSSGLALLANEVDQHRDGRCGRPWRQVLPLPGAGAEAGRPAVLAGARR